MLCIYTSSFPPEHKTKAVTNKRSPIDSAMGSVNISVLTLATLASVGEHSSLSSYEHLLSAAWWYYVLSTLSTLPHLETSVKRKTT